MYSVWFDLRDGDQWDLYAGGGLGKGHTTLDYNIELKGVFKATNEGPASMNWVPIQQVGAGVTLKLFDHGELDVGYRWLRSSRGHFGEFRNLHLEPRVRHRIMAGLKFFLFGG